jgi:protein-S-isoprenylcysteine O-methyltransferase Ste14
MSGWRRLVPGAAFVFYLLIALEAVIMITPFTVYFYAVYAPVLGTLEARPWTAWLTAFFLPHITYTGDPFLTALAWLGPIVLTLGLGVFLVCAVQVYSAKLFRHGVVSGGLYRLIRHPQYLGLGVAGLGLLLYWPRFIILLLYLSMLFVYSLLARHEEQRMEARFGEAYRRYRDGTWMFLPGEPGRRVFSWLFGWTRQRGWAIAAGYVLVLAGATGLAFGLRAYSLSRIPMVRYSDTLTVVSLSPAGGAAMERALATVLGNPEVTALLGKFHQPRDHALVAYLVPRAYMMQHLIADLGEHEAHHGKGEEGGAWGVVRHLGEMYALAPLRQLRDGTWSPEKRVIFAEALTAAGSVVPASRALDAGVLRFPLFFADVDRDTVTMAMETPRRHAWGTIPVPAF